MGTRSKSTLGANTLLELTEVSNAPISVQLGDYSLDHFMNVAAGFGSHDYAYVVTPNTDHLIRYCDDAGFRDLYRAADFALLDSRFLAFVLKVTKGVELQACPGSDITSRLFSQVIAPDDKIIVIGGSEEQAAILVERYGLRGMVHYNPPMGFIRDTAEVEACLDFIENHSPFRFCLLAVGCPQQEIIARALQARGRAKGLALCVGASINFLTGSERRAPLWMQTAGIEWAYRLINDPGRMARRYLLRGPRIFFLLPRLRFILRPPVPGNTTHAVTAVGSPHS